MACKVVFPANEHREQTLTFYQVQLFRFKKTWETLSNSGEVTLARNVSSYRGDRGTKDTQMWKNLIRKDDRIEIYAGYNAIPDELPLRFSGYVSGIGLEAPITVRFEDEMRVLKKKFVKVSHAKTTVKKMVEAVLPPGIETHITDVPLHKVAISKRTVAQVLQSLKDQVGLQSYFQRGRLVIGEVYFDDSETVILDYNRNVKASGLEYVDREEFPTQVTVKYIGKDGKRYEGVVGVEGGNEISVWDLRVQSEADAKKVAAKIHEHYAKSGYEGVISTFGNLVIDHGMQCEIRNSEFPERDGVYWIKSVEEIFSSNTKYKVIVELDYQVG